MTEVERPAPAPAPRHRLRWRRWVPRALFEGGLIVLSILLALAASQWVGAMKDARRVAEMRQFLIAEIRANREDLGSDRYIPRHETLKHAFARVGGSPDARVTRETAEPAIGLLFRGGLSLPSVRDAVWTSVSSSDVFEMMPPEEVFLLARVYKAQEGLEGVKRAGYDIALGQLDVLADEGSAHREVMRMTLYMEDLIHQEKALLALYDSALETLDPEGEAPAATRADDAGRTTG